MPFLTQKNNELTSLRKRRLPDAKLSDESGESARAKDGVPRGGRLDRTPE